MTVTRDDDFRPELAAWAERNFDTGARATDVRAALVRARSARFEHGEQG
jgi:hypothetical protein